MKNETHHTKDLHPSHRVDLFCIHCHSSLCSCGENFSVGARKQGSVLVFALIILSIMLMSGLAISTTAMRATKGAISSDKSVQAFQLAESGLEIVLKDIKDVQDNVLPVPPATSYTIEDIGSANSACKNTGIECSASCASGTLTINILAISSDTVNDKIDLTFFKEVSGTPTPMDCVDPLSDVTSIKSVGTYQGTSRAVETSSN